MSTPSSSPGFCSVLGSLGDRVRSQAGVRRRAARVRVGLGGVGVLGDSHLLIAARGLMGLGAGCRSSPSTPSRGILTQRLRSRSRIGLEPWGSGRVRGLGVAIRSNCRRLAAGALLVGIGVPRNVPGVALGLVASIWLVSDSKSPLRQAPRSLRRPVVDRGHGAASLGDHRGAPTERGSHRSCWAALSGSATLVLRRLCVWDSALGPPLARDLRSSDAPIFQRGDRARWRSCSLRLAGVIFLLTQCTSQSLFRWDVTLLQAGLHIGAHRLISSSWSHRHVERALPGGSAPSRSSPPAW